MITKFFAISGMHCTACVLNIDGELEETDGVVSCSTNYAKQETKVEFDDKKISEKKLVDIIKSVGYDATIKE